MKTLSEIEAAAAALPPAEMEDLERKLHEMNRVRREGRKVFTGRDAVDWWHERSHLPADEAEAFARDVEAARGEVTYPPKAPEWE